MKLAVSSALIALAFAGCAHQQEADRMEELKDAVQAYNEAFRWKNYDRAVDFLPKPMREAFIVAYEDESSDLQIEDFKVSNVEIESESEARVVVRLSYMLLPSVVLQKARLVQQWRYIEDKWILESEENSIRELDEALIASETERLEAKTDEESKDEKTKVDVLKPGEEPPEFEPTEPESSPER